MAAMVMPRNTSSDTSLSLAVPGCGPLPDCAAGNSTTAPVVTQPSWIWRNFTSINLCGQACLQKLVDRWVNTEMISGHHGPGVASHSDSHTAAATGNSLFKKIKGQPAAAPSLSRK